MTNAEAAAIISQNASPYGAAVVQHLGLDDSKAATAAVVEYLRSDEFAKIARSFMTSPLNGSEPRVNQAKLVKDVAHIIEDAGQMERKGRASYVACLKLMELSK